MHSPSNGARRRLYLAVGLGLILCSATAIGAAERSAKPRHCQPAERTTRNTGPLVEEVTDITTNITVQDGEATATMGMTGHTVQRGQSCFYKRDDYTVNATKLSVDLNILVARDLLNIPNFQLPGVPAKPGVPALPNLFRRLQVHLHLPRARRHRQRSLGGAEPTRVQPDHR